MGPVMPQASGLPAYTGSLVSVATRSMSREISSSMTSTLPAGKACLPVHGVTWQFFSCTLTYYALTDVTVHVVAVCGPKAELSVRSEISRVPLSLPTSMSQIPCRTVWVVAFSAGRSSRCLLPLQRLTGECFQHHERLTMDS